MQFFWLLIVIVILGFLFLVENRLRYILKLSPEASRKLIHSGIGVVTASFPMMFVDVWPVVILTFSSVMILAYVRLFLKESLGQALHGVKRESIGEFVFPVGVLACWVISQGNGLYYTISILILAFADATAAIIGVKYGRIKYSTKEGFKSWEGSAAFFGTSFFCVFVPLMLVSSFSGVECFLIGVMISLIVMLLEGFSWRGLDNLFIPVTSIFILFRYEGLSVQILLTKFFVLTTLLLFVYLLRKKTSLDDSSLFAAALTIYLSYVLGGYLWAFAPIILFSTYQWCFPTVVKDFHNNHDITLLLYIATPGLFWLICYQIMPKEIFLYGFVICFITELVGLGYSRIVYLNDQISNINAAVKASLISALLFVPYFLMFSFFMNLYILLVTVVSGFLLILLYHEMRETPISAKRWIIQTFISFGLSAIGVFIL